jgi:hypothetical protein
MAISRDPKARPEQANEHPEALLHDEQRETYWLAARIMDKLDPEKSILELEELGEEKLRQIVAWMEEKKGRR